MREPSPAILECQACGAEIRKLTPDEKRDIVYHPYNYITYCWRGACQEMMRDEANGYF